MVSPAALPAGLFKHWILLLFFGRDKGFDAPAAVDREASLLHPLSPSGKGLGKADKTG
jgi:hypothetical protein